MLTSAIERGCFDQRLTRFDEPGEMFVANTMTRQCYWRNSPSVWRGNTLPLPIDIPFQPRRVPICRVKFCRRRTEVRRKILEKSYDYDPCNTKSECYRNNLSRSHLIIFQVLAILLAYIKFSLFKFFFIMSEIKISTILLVFIVWTYSNLIIIYIYSVIIFFSANIYRMPDN